MSGYPYWHEEGGPETSGSGADGPVEAFPDTPEHRAWRREWNTRAPEPWLPRLAGGR